MAINTTRIRRLLIAAGAVLLALSVAATGEGRVAGRAPATQNQAGCWNKPILPDWCVNATTDPINRNQPETWR